MKGKITIVLLSLALVFGMIAASCGDGDYPENPYKNQDPNNTKEATDFHSSDLDPANIVARKVAALNAEAGGIKLGTMGSGATYDATNRVVKVEGTGRPPGTWVVFTITATDLPATTPTWTPTVGDKIKITYSCVVASAVKEAGKAPVGVKDNNGDNIGDDNANTFFNLVEGTGKDITFTVATGKDVSVIRFEHNTYDDAATYYVKILKVEKVTS
jgi:hypothetical protein